MSELTPCNHCSLRDIKRRAAREGLQVTVSRDASGWTNIYVHPPEVTELSSSRGEWGEYQVASMMKVTDGCVC